MGLLRCVRNNVGGERGVILIGVLWIIVLLTLVVTVLAKTARMDGRVSLAFGDSIRGYWACRAGLERAIGILEDDSAISDSLDDLWSDNDLDLTGILMAGCEFSVVVEDESGKLNVNTVTKKQLMELEGMTESIADSILDWRDENDEVQGSGTEGGYYSNLRPGYEIRNGPFRTVRELLLVRGVTRELLFGEDTNMNGILDYNENDGAASRPKDNGDGKLALGWYRYLTCTSWATNKDGYGADRVNINEASESELQNTLGLSESHAKWIVENRNRGFRSIGDLIERNSPKEPSDRRTNRALRLDLQTFMGIADRITVKDEDILMGLVNVNTASAEVLRVLFEDDQEQANALMNYRNTVLYGLSSIADLLQVEAIGVDGFKKLAEHVTVRSNVFRVTSQATSDQTGSVYRLVAIVDRSERPTQILYLHEGSGY